MKKNDSLPFDTNSYVSYLAKKCTNKIDLELYAKYDVKRGLRDISGRGVMAGLTEISEVKAYIIDDGELVPCEGKLYYRGYEIHDLVNGFISAGRFGFEEITFLLLFGSLPTVSELENFKSVLAEYRKLPTHFVRDIIMKAPSKDMMNTLARSVLTMYSYDENPDDTSVENVLKQCLELIALSPLFSVYGYQTYGYYHDNRSFVIHSPKPEFSAAENILHLLRPDSKFSSLEATILDLALVLHAEHGGGNNSTFTARVVTSSLTDTYSAMAAALGSLKGPRHGGANIKVSQMFEDMKKNIRDWKDEDAVRTYIAALLDKNAFDRSGLIYGMGHAVYSVSDPRAQIFKKYVKSLSEEKGCTDEFELYSLVERLAPEVIAEKRRIYKGVSANIDFYSGFVYSMLGLPQELYTPIFANARIVGWSAHRIEELLSNGKIIRPAYKNVTKKREYTELEKR
ncbi:MAG: citrate/2-methylcitrate synthase [Clostridia bacterium]|nr:citrate/2-methylcitrate synthase [Clostridia bacterium]